MKQLQSLTGAAVIALLLIALMTDWLTVAVGALASISWWVYLVVAGILFSGYKFVSSSKEDHQIDHEWAEQEGNVYIRRMEEERKRRGKDSGREYGNGE